MRLANVGLVAGIVISNAIAAEPADWFGIAPSAFLTLRNEFYDDIVGSRTGHAKYSEHSLGLTWWPDRIITPRPEVRFDHSYDTTAFDNGMRRNQFIASMDFILHF